MSIGGSPIRVFAWVTVAILLGTAIASANLITFERWQSRRGRVMVMDETGTAVTELYACDRGVPCGIDPSISPPGPDGTAWIAFNGWDLYRIREDGTDLTMMLCRQGTDLFTDPYQLTSSSQEWSPDGTEILVQTMSNLALIDADFVVGPDCASPLEPIYSYDWQSGEPVGWNLEGHAAWNDDGSKIAFFEAFFEQGEDLPLLNRLVILEREETGGWEVERTIETEPALPNAFLFDIDWQPDGALLAFSSREETGPKLMWVNLDGPDSGYLLSNGRPLEGRSPSWSPDGSQLIFDDLREKLFKWSYVASTFPDGPVEAMGSGHRSDWQRDALTSCGDGSCMGSEDFCNCPDDCVDPPSIVEDPALGHCTDGVDNDCDGDTDGLDLTNCCWDDDGDGYTSASCGGLDCDDDNAPLINPGANELCTNNVDDDCDGSIDCDDADCGPDDGCSVDCPLRTSRHACKLEQSCRWDSRNRLCLNK